MKEAICRHLCAGPGLHPGIARSHRLVAAAHRPGDAPDRRARCEPFTIPGFSLALGISDGARPVAGIQAAPLEYIKIDARLLYRYLPTALRGDGRRANLPVRCGGGCPPIIALGVETEETAMRLIDLGIDLDGRDWFSAPRRMSRATPFASMGPGAAAGIDDGKSRQSR